MKVLLLVALVFAVRGQDDPVTVDYSFTCVSGATDADRVNCTSTAADDAAAKAAAKCHSPAVVADNAFTSYGCGACPDDAAEGTCVACGAYDSTINTTANNCNTYKAPIVSFNCYKAGVSAACDPAEAIACFGPMKAYSGNEASLTDGGCGTCAAALAAATNATWTVDDCKDCDTADCNSAFAMLSFLAPLIAMLWIA